MSYRFLVQSTVESRVGRCCENRKWSNLLVFAAVVAWNWIYSVEEVKQTKNLRFPTMKLDELNFKKIAIICGCTLVGGLTFSFGLFPMILKFMLKQVGA